MSEINRVKVSENFYLSEFQSPDTGEVKIHPDLIRRLQRLRDILQLPIRVNSGYRTPEHNLEVGGVPKSYHCQGMAADITCSLCSLKLLTVLAIWAGFTGVIVYNRYDFIHVDVREGKVFLVPSEWVDSLKTIFPDLAPYIQPWAGVQNIGTVEK